MNSRFTYAYLVSISVKFSVT